MLQEEEDRETGKLGVPLNPEVLRRIGLLTEFPPVPDGFRPDGDWALGYRTIACRGYADKGNDTVGALLIRRTAKAWTSK